MKLGGQVGRDARKNLLNLGVYPYLDLFFFDILANLI